LNIAGDSPLSGKPSFTDFSKMKRTPLVLTPGNFAIVEATSSITFMSISDQRNYRMKKAILHISGDVRQSGFRAKIVNIAKALDIKGYVANLVTF
jgi:hypothetical protein